MEWISFVLIIHFLFRKLRRIGFQGNGNRESRDCLVMIRDSLRVEAMNHFNCNIYIIKLIYSDDEVLIK